MNENINLCEILKDCTSGTKFFSYIHGAVEFNRIDNSNTDYPISIKAFNDNGNIIEDVFTKEGKYSDNYKDSKCILVPSFEQPDWSKWECPKPKKPKFDPKTLKPFDKVLVRISNLWRVNFFSNKEDDAYRCIDYSFKYCIPYNEDTKHLIGTTEEAPEYYRYWEESRKSNLNAY